MGNEEFAWGPTHLLQILTDKRAEHGWNPELSLDDEVANCDKLGSRFSGCAAQKFARAELTKKRKGPVVKMNAASLRSI